MHFRKITYKCQVLTPLFLFGAQRVVPELRPTSIKGALRFWWRALNAQNFSLSELKRIEESTFGSTNQKSKLFLKIEKRVFYKKREKVEMLPHKPTPNSRSPLYCIPTNETFNISITIPHEIKLQEFQISIFPKDIDRLFKCFCILGGFGKRSRRGFGSINILETKWNNEAWEKYNAPETLEDIQKELLRDHFQFCSRENIIRPKKLSAHLYPHILSIELGAFPENGEEITKKIIEDAHDTKENNGWKYDIALGSGSPRFASPVYVSVIDTKEGQRSIITTLKTVDKNNKYREELHGAIQKEYKDRLKNEYSEN